VPRWVALPFRYIHQHPCRFLAPVAFSFHTWSPERTSRSHLHKTNTQRGSLRFFSETPRTRARDHIGVTYTCTWQKTYSSLVSRNFCIHHHQPEENGSMHDTWLQSGEETPRWISTSAAVKPNHPSNHLPRSYDQPAAGGWSSLLVVPSIHAGRNFLRSGPEKLTPEKSYNGCPVIEDRETNLVFTTSPYI
jgi:hypothetical protein